MAFDGKEKSMDLQYEMIRDEVGPIIGLCPKCGLILVHSHLDRYDKDLEQYMNCDDVDDGILACSECGHTFHYAKDDLLTLNKYKALAALLSNPLHKTEVEKLATIKEDLRHHRRLE